ncbi:MAG: hypothetical protein ACI4IW_08445 [Oscillospiraceae bacterium]
MKLNKLLAFALALALLLCGCGAEKAAYEYTAGYTVDTEPCGDSRIFPTHYEETAAGENIYQFSPEISLEERADFIEKEEALLEKWASLCEDVPGGFTFRVLPGYFSRSDSESRTAYFGINEAGTYKQAIATVLTIFGDFTNYGYCYALANDLSAQLGWETEETAELDMEVFAAEPALFNLSYPCFTELCSTEEEIAAAKALSIEIYSSLGRPYSGDGEFAAAAAAKAAALGVKDFSPSYVGFAYGGGSCPLRARTLYLDVMRDSSYKADAITEYTGESDWMGRVSTLIETLENLDQKLSRQREAFGFDGDYLVPTVFKDEIHVSSSEFWGYFTPSSLDIQAVAVSIIPHEYNHYLFHVCADYDGIFGIDSGANPYLEGWHGEALANYFGCEELYTSFIAVYGDQTFEYYKSITGRELTKPIDMAEYFDCQLSMSYRLDPKMSPKYFMSLKGRETVSFSAYVARNYGEENLVNILLHPGKSPEYVGKTFDEVEAEWDEYIKNGLVLPPSAEEWVQEALAENAEQN